MRSHRLDPNLSLKCGINSYTEEYTIYESFRSHVYRKHRDVLYPNTTDSDDDSEEIEDNGDDNNALEVTSDDEDENIESGSSQTTTSTSSAKRAASLFILKTREENSYTNCIKQYCTWSKRVMEVCYTKREGKYFAVLLV